MREVCVIYGSEPILALIGHRWVFLLITSQWYRTKHGGNAIPSKL